jgi:hypothetical protein
MTSAMTSALRQAQVPLDHVFAELLAYPLASEAAFAAAATRLEPDGPAGAGLWREFEREVFRANPGVTLDEITSLRDRIWFDSADPGPGRAALHAYLRRHAAGLLAAAGTAAVPRTSADGAEPERYFPVDAEDSEAGAAARRRWRWVSFALPPDLLLAALPSDPPPTRVETLTPALRAVLADRGYAEAHVHVGAALAFPDLWASLQFTLAQPGCDPSRFRSSGAAFDGGRDFGGWLLRAAIGRCVLAAYLTDGRRRHDGLADYLRNEPGPRLQARFGLGVERALLTGLEELAAGRPHPSPPAWDDLRRVYRELYEGLARPADDISQLGRIDPVAPLFGWADGSAALPEVSLVRAALEQLEELARAGRPDAALERLFWQCVRARCLFYRHVTQRPLTPGLHWFLRFFKRISGGRAWFDEHGSRTVASAFRLHGPGAGLRSLEVRTSPADSRHRMADYLAKARDGVPPWARRGADRCEFGLVLHFTKERGDQTTEGNPSAHGAKTFADPAGNPTHFRYAAYDEVRSRQAGAWAELFEHHPPAVRLIRGVDVCSDERAIPNWVLVGSYRRVADAGAAAAARLGDGTPPPRRTIHVGEDFVHLLSGLRLVAEAVRFFGLREGDRLGHALALGVDALDWAGRTGRVALRREERLFDLAWEWHWCTHRPRVGPNRLPFVESELRRLSRAVFGRALPPAEVCDLVIDLHAPKRLRAVGFSNNVPEPEHLLGDPWDATLRAYLCSEAVFRAGQATEWVVVHDEGPLIAALQAEVRHEVGCRGVAVEVNPSSNLLIGDFGDLKHHPFWRLAGPPGHAGDAPPVTVCLGSDDPITFATDLRQEYQLVYDALVTTGCSAHQALGWVDRVRADGLAARFTRPAPD